MKKTKNQLTIADEKIISRIYLIRGKKVMLDKDLAELYNVPTKVLNQAVKRNLRRFPEDFIFQLSKDEFEILKSQIVTSSWGGARKLPIAFPEQGVAMLASVLKSETAIEVSIQIIRVFTRMREFLLTHGDILLKLEKIEKQLIEHGTNWKKHEEEIQTIFDALKELMHPVQPPRKRIGYRINNNE